ncbi:hypothetical protein HMSSN139_35480 [Paenibacillus sp. HMSSN-139]|nr:hypothetical protein HMSSN139_35480 [Paenibacillus sp. HMSSN-139]
MDGTCIPSLKYVTCPVLICPIGSVNIQEGDGCNGPVSDCGILIRMEYVMGGENMANAAKKQFAVIGMGRLVKRGNCTQQHGI